MLKKITRLVEANKYNLKIGDMINMPDPVRVGKQKKTKYKESDK